MTMTRLIAGFGILILCFSGCDRPSVKDQELKTGIWRGVIDIQNHDLPFNFDVVADGKNGYDILLRNAGEELLLDEIQVAGDSVDIGLHIFDATIKAKIIGDSLKGVFIKNYEKNYRLPFRAAYGQTFRFEKAKSDNQ